MYKVGKLFLEIYNIKNEHVIGSLKQFFVECNSKHIEYELKYLDNFNSYSTDKCFYYNENYAIERLNSEFRYYFILNNTIYAIVEEQENKYIIYLCKTVITHKVHKYFLASLLLLERTLIKFESFCLHSSYISYKNQAILFTAPSGAGKSTQADLWMKYKNAEILNGDRNIVGKDGKQWFVYGTPFSGSSEYCINRTTPLNAIIILEKGPINLIKRLDIKGFQKVFSEVTVCPWDKEFCNKVIDLVMNVCNEIPVYLYSCTKDEKAVDFLYKRLVKDGVIGG